MGVLSSLIEAGAGLVNGMVSAGSQAQINERNIAFQQEQNELNRQFQQDINNQNISFQQEQNEIERQRADTAMQRKVDDFTKAGFSPLAVAGSSGYAQAVTSAPRAEASGGLGISPRIQSPIQPGTFESVVRALSQMSSQEHDKTERQKDRDLTRAITDSNNEIKMQIESSALEQEDKHFYDQLSQVYELDEKRRQHEISQSAYNRETEKMLQNLRNMAQSSIEDKKLVAQINYWTESLARLDLQIENAKDNAEKDRKELQKSRLWSNIWQGFRTALGLSAEVRGWVNPFQAGQQNAFNQVLPF